jgi:hypothetical protein
MIGSPKQAGQSNMKRTLIAAISLIALASLQGCVSPLVEGQKRELEAYEAKGLLVQEKNTALAATLGILPIAGYAYTGRPGLAISTIPLYIFLGPIWMPFDAYNGAQARNYYATKESIEKRKAKEIRDNDHEMEDKRIDYEQHIRNQRVIEDKYSAYR